jgi:hypothetical protein
MEKRVQIVIPAWLRDEKPMTASFCELVNSALTENPKMSLEEFALQLSEVNVRESLKRVLNEEKKQFGGMNNETL